MFDLAIPTLSWETINAALFIFMLRITDVSLGTLRMIMITRGKRLLATTLGFVEATIWVVAVSQVLTNLDTLWNVVSYSSGYAAGTLLGMWLEEKLALGVVEVGVVSIEKGPEIVQKIRDAGYGATKLQAKGRSGPVTLIVVVVERKHLAKIIGLVSAIDPLCSITVDDQRHVIRGTLGPDNKAELRLLRRPAARAATSDKFRFLRRLSVALSGKTKLKSSSKGK